VDGHSPEPPARDRLERHRPGLLRVARLSLFERARARLDPEDLVQQTFEEVLVHPERLAGMSDARLHAYLVAAVRNNTRDENRRESGEVPLDLCEESSQKLLDRLGGDLTTPSMRAMRAEQFALLADAIAGLPDAQRVAVVLRFIDGLRVADIAARMNKNANAVSQLLYRALTALRGMLEDPSG
jgi:RNA polymerase sigma-70 factor (ECF subfamily)